MTKLNSDAEICPGADWPSDIRAELVRDRANGKVGQKLFSETDQVRVWGLTLAPGERLGFHRHVLNYFWVAVTAGRSLSRYATGESSEFSYEPGMTRHFSFEKGEFILHDLTNIGDTELVFTTVEFKNSVNQPLLIR
ncbi:hypothetical protein [Mesorhizobium sp. M2A.F.Ca.ET.039.01.1.1]|uniref:hypothetical protein n=1 Tax=Mesorhizobium sp. M2A.F.Ca.ET.039.01.1.1 TaxID=2496746 RepID=UPI000FCAEE62|nr:hypothetical protein [Mesorhizobium sp. M2A.F.Ca.ET.039.01.1.1]RWX70660.1 hypothetical protein EOA24_08365 [Mesorhizobium sp. M2A.F.Ca.ET.039.01.1.1]TIV39308.1 MAG: hypothetical protein E5V99_04850 [Mesorhizobium sp.]TIV47595.1 MAG: hypothetical protein E5V96_02675 [Mesorhizobium sp.]